MSPPRALQLRDALAHGYLATLLWDSWSHPETRTQATTWGLILHVIYFGSGSETARRLLHGPSFMMAHSVLAGWLQLTYFNPQIDLADKVRLWGCSRPASIARTLVVHVLTVAAHWTLLHLDKKELRALFSNKSALELLLRTVAPQVALLLFYGQVFPSLTGTYGITTVSNERLHKLQTVAIVASNLLAFTTWRRVLFKTKAA